jgi:Zn-dependent protease with chaperone function
LAASFFENQQLARRNTRVMLAFFLLAVLAVVATVDLIVGAVYLWNVTVHVPRGAPPPGLVQLFSLVPVRVYVWGAILTAGTIFVVSLFNMAKLSGGGAAVARMVGARRIAPDTRDALERRLVNVIEEMAIASGVRVPAAYVMDGERGINAFAAGWDASGAVIAVTRGTLETLTRDELQGVIGHEFSHILNGDMRLNIRMLGVLAGIVFIGSIGSFLMRNTGRSRDSRGTAALIAIGLALLVIGYTGLFFARLIKAKVSREREYLADASSVQFTRNPDGIAGALDQIRASSAGAAISARHAEELSHMFFGESVRLSFGGLFDTHPSIEDRIERVHPGFQPSSYRGRRPAPGSEAGTGAGATTAVPPPEAAAGFADAPVQEGRRPGDIGTEWGRSASDSAKLVGTLSAGKVDYAARLVASLPPELRASLREADGACAALIALLLAPAEDVMQRQLQALEAAGMSALSARARATVVHTRRLGPVFQLPVVDLALPALKGASDAARLELLAAFQAVIQEDRRVTLHEFVVLTLVRQQLAPKGRPGAATRKLADLREQAGLLLLLMAHAGTRADAAGERQSGLQAALDAGAKEMGLAQAPVPQAALTLDAVAAALDALKTLAPLQKALLVKGHFAAVTADGAIRVAEAELMRLAGAVLDCPLPPLIENLDPATLVA